MENPSIYKTNILKIDNHLAKEVEDDLVVEEPLEITISSLESKPILHKKPISITMRTPSNDKELAVGFLYGEGILKKVAQIKNIRTDENKIDIVLHRETSLDLKKLDRHFYTTSSCGVCGKTSIESIETKRPNHFRLKNMTINSEVILSLPDILREKQSLFKSTGGIHAAGIFNNLGELLCVREDVGRHNAMDKVVGNYFIQDQIPLDQSILTLSGRASFELLQKAIMAGIQIVVSIGAPSSLALAIAKPFNVTLIGFVKENRFNIYNGKERIIL